MNSYRPSTASPSGIDNAKAALIEEAKHLGILSFMGKIDLKERANGGSPILEAWFIDYRGRNILFRCYVFGDALYQIFM
jgi:hypothetical protein